MITPAIRVGPWIQPRNHDQLSIMWESETPYTLTYEARDKFQTLAPRALEVPPQTDQDDPATLWIASVPAPSIDRPLIYNIDDHTDEPTQYCVRVRSLATFRFLHLSNPNSWTGKPVHLASWILPLASSLDALVVSGDITTNGSNRAFARFFNRIRGLCATVPMILAPGNHDVPVSGNLRRNYAAWVHGTEPAYDIMGNLAQRFFTVPYRGIDWICLDDSIPARLLRDVAFLDGDRFEMPMPPSDGALRATVCNGNFLGRNTSVDAAVSTVVDESDLLLTVGRSSSQPSQTVWIQSGAAEHHAHTVEIIGKRATTTLCTRDGRTVEQRGYQLRHPWSEDKREAPPETQPKTVPPAVPDPEQIMLGEIELRGERYRLWGEPLGMNDRGRERYQLWAEPWGNNDHGR